MGGNRKERRRGTGWRARQSRGRKNSDWREREKL